MKENEVIEGNKLIAEFMGILESSGTTLSESGIIVSAKGYDYRGEFLLLDELRYNTSWDWLMPVVKKCAEINKVRITDDLSVSIFVHNYIEIVWSAAVNFIKWYNSR